MEDIIITVKQIIECPKCNSSKIASYPIKVTFMKNSRMKVPLYCQECRNPFAAIFHIELEKIDDGSKGKKIL